MDIKHRTAYARVKIIGVADPILLNDGVSLARLLGVEIPMALHHAPSRYNKIQIEIDFNPINLNQTSQERDFDEFIGAVDLSQVEIESDMQSSDRDTSSIIWHLSPLNPESESYDPLYAEYIRCYIPQHRETKTPADLATLRKHVESRYADTRWWNGSHRF